MPSVLSTTVEETARGERVTAIVRANRRGSPPRRPQHRRTTTAELFQVGDTVAAEGNVDTAQIKRRSRR